MMALTQQMQTYSIKQIKIRLKIKLLTHSKGASLDILIISHSQLTNLELSWSTQNLASLSENGHCGALRVGLGPGTGEDDCWGQDLCIVLCSIHAVSLFFVSPVTGRKWKPAFRVLCWVYEFQTNTNPISSKARRIILGKPGWPFFWRPQDIQRWRLINTAQNITSVSSWGCIQGQTDVKVLQRWM